MTGQNHETQDCEMSARSPAAVSQEYRRCLRTNGSTISPIILVLEVLGLGGDNSSRFAMRRSTWLAHTVCSREMATEETASH